MTKSNYIYGCGYTAFLTRGLGKGRKRKTRDYADIHVKFSDKHV